MCPRQVPQVTSGAWSDQPQSLGSRPGRERGPLRLRLGGVAVPGLYLPRRAGQADYRGATLGSLGRPLTGSTVKTVISFSAVTMIWSGPDHSALLK